MITKDMERFVHIAYDPTLFSLFLTLVPKKRPVLLPIYENPVKSRMSERNMHLKIEICINQLKYT